MFVADAHCDTLSAVGVENREIGSCTVTPERMKVGGVGLQTFAMFAGHEGMAGHPYERGRRMIDSLEKLGVPVFAGKLPETPPDAPAGVLSIEGGEMLEGSLERLGEFDDRCRVRMIALTWNNENEIGYPAKSGSAEGLKPFGKTLLREMRARGVYADVSHLNEAGFWDVADAGAPIVASHSNCKALCGHFRNLTDRQIRAVVESGGFIGINFYSLFLKDEPGASVEDVVRHIDRVMELGGERALGFGSDFDGIDAWPDGLANPADFPSLLLMLLERGYTREQVAGIAGGNLWRLLKAAENA